MLQDLGPLGKVDLLTSDELQREMGHHMDWWIRERYRGEKLLKFPVTRVTASGTSVILSPTGNDQGAPIGPEQGYLWRIHHVLVTSSSLTDTAKYILYASSDPTDFTQIRLLDGMTFTPGVTQPTPPAISVGTSPFTFMNVQSYGVFVTVTGGTVSAITINGQPTGVTSGTFFLAPNSYITVTYSIAPTMTEVNANSNVAASLGFNVNIAYNPSQRSTWLFPGEQIYPVVNGTTSGNTYALMGIASEVPMEMQGKFL